MPDPTRPGAHRALALCAEAKILLDRGAPPLLIPAGALVVGIGEPHVVTLGADRRVRSVPVQIGRDYGATMEVLSGLKQGDVLVLSPSDELKDGVRVRVASQGAR